MPEYPFEAISTVGASTRGLLTAENEVDLAAKLAACDLTLTRVSDTAEITFPSSPSIAPAEELQQSLRVLAQETRSPLLRRQIRGYLAAETAGAGQNKPDTFTAALLDQCAATGDPLTALGPLISFERDLGRVRQDSQGRFLYAYGLLLFASTLFSATDFFVGESFRAMFRDFEIKLPRITLVMLNVGPVFWSMTLCLAGLPLIIFASRMFFSKIYWFDRGLDMIPLWGPWRRWRYSAGAFAYLGSALKAPLPFPVACEAAARILPRPYSAWQLRELSRRIQEGANLSAALELAQVHPMVRPFLLASERRSALPVGCMTAARLFLERCRRRRMFFAYFTESFAMVFVLVTALALFTSYLLPIYSLLVALSR